jgi:hypothetical protein
MFTDENLAKCETILESGLADDEAKLREWAAAEFEAVAASPELLRAAECWSGNIARGLKFASMILAFPKPELVELATEMINDNFDGFQETVAALEEVRAFAKEQLPDLLDSAFCRVTAAVAACYLRQKIGGCPGGGPVTLISCAWPANQPLVETPFAPAPAGAARPPRPAVTGAVLQILAAGAPQRNCAVY